MEGLQYIQQFNKIGGQQNLIQKALTSASGVAEALIPQELEKVITDITIRLLPELSMVNPVYHSGKRHEFNRLTALPRAGGAMGEGGTTPTVSSTYERDYVEKKVIRSKGAVTYFLQDASQDFIDAAAVEMENLLTKHAYDLGTNIVWGNGVADPYSFSGLDYFISTNREVEVSAGVVPTDLKFLDKMIDANLRKRGAMHRKVFLMSPEMLSKVSQLLTNVRLNQGLIGSGMTQVDVNGGWRLNAYRDIPIVMSNLMRPVSTMGTVSTTTTTSGGYLPDTTTYYFRVAPVTWEGEQLASAEVSQATGTAGSSINKITLSWTAVDNALYYRIYQGTSTGAANTTLKHICSAFTYDSSGTPTPGVASYVVQYATATSEVPTHMQSDVPLLATGGVPSETVMLWDLDDYQGMGKFVYTNQGGSKFNGLVTIDKLDRFDDWLSFLIKTYGALVPSFEATSYIHRGLRTE